MKRRLQQLLAVLMLVPVFYSCATYNSSMGSYYSNLQAGNFEKAKHNLENNKLIKKDRNALLYNLEMGKLFRLQNDLRNSNNYLNVADNLMESNRKSIADVALSNLVNPMHQAYRGEDYEKFMMHYYKVLNYAAQGNTEEAVVEARRITLSTYKQDEKFTNKDNRYSKDAFALNLQGMIYEMAGENNNAFIAYRNAAELYIKNNNDYYGVKMPAQLQQDVLRTARAIGFVGDEFQYEKVFNTSYKINNNENGALILFIEEGQAPVKEENNILLTSAGNGVNSFNYIDFNGQNANFNFDNTAYNISNNKLSSLRTFKLSLPTYRVQYLQQQNIKISNDSIFFDAQLAQNINSVAVNVMKERFLTELANALVRQLTKKLVEEGVTTLAEGIARSTDKRDATDSNKEEQEKLYKKKEDRINTVGEIAGFAMNIFNAVNEKADTRNWQSLPAFVHYVRIPLHAGENNIKVVVSGTTKTIKVNGRKGLQMMGVEI